MIKFKWGVVIDGIKQETISAMAIVHEEYQDFTYNLFKGSRDLVVTSVLDGKHKTGSKHYEGHAFDIRTWNTDTNGVQWSMERKELFAKLLRKALGEDYDVIVEDTHIHVEFHKKD
jgi:cellulose biosynthesis protein BcsQ